VIDSLVIPVTSYATWDGIFSRYEDTHGDVYITIEAVMCRDLYGQWECLEACFPSWSDNWGAVTFHNTKHSDPKLIQFCRNSNGDSWLDRVEKDHGQ
jgi:hypothetical protein